MLVVDGQTNVQRLYRSGVRESFGRDGDGPGEFRGVFDVRWIDSSQIAVFDIRHFRVERFRLDRSFLGSTSLPINSDFDAPRMRRNFAAFARSEGAPVVGTAVPARVEIFPFDSASSPRTVEFSGLAVHTALSDFQQRRLPFEAEVLWDIADDGRMAIAFGAEDSVRVLNSRGDTELVLHTGWTAMAISAAARDSAKFAVLNPGRGPALAPSFKAQMEQRLKDFPTAFPVIDRLWFDSRNWLWIRRGASEDGVNRDFLVMNPAEPQLKYRLLLPLAQQPADAVGGVVLIWTVYEDGTGRLEVAEMQARGL